MDPIKSICTPRLTVRRVSEEDWEDIRLIWIDFAGSEYAIYDTPKQTDERDVRETVSRWAECSESSDHMFWAVCLEDRVIGFYSFNISSEGNDDGRLAYYVGYCFHSDQHGKGYAFESFSAIADFIKNTMDRPVTLIAGTAEKNVPSVRFLRSAGFSQFYRDMQYFHKDEKGRPLLFSSLWFRKEL